MPPNCSNCPATGASPIPLLAKNPTNASLGQHTIAPDPRGYRVSSYFDVSLQLSDDGGATWANANRSMRLYAGMPPARRFDLCQTSWHQFCFAMAKHLHAAIRHQCTADRSQSHRSHDGLHQHGWREPNVLPPAAIASARWTRQIKPKPGLRPGLALFRLAAFPRPLDREFVLALPALPPLRA